MITTVELLLKTLNSSRDILESLFEKRNRIVYIHEVAADISIEKLNFLEEIELVTINNDTVELSDKVIDFFEEFLDTSSDISIGDIDEQLENFTHFIALYSNEDDFLIKQDILKKIRRVLKKIPAMVLKSLVQLSLHVQLSYKTQTNFKNKVRELEFYQNKLQKLILIEQKVYKTLDIEKSFFINLYDMEIVELEQSLKTRLKELRVSLIKLQKEVSEYINKVLAKISFWQHIIKLKELKDNFEIKETTNIKELCSSPMPLSLSSNELNIKTQLDFEMIYDISFNNKIKRIVKNKKLQKPQKSVASAIDSIYFDNSKLTKTIIDTQKLNKEFLQTSYDLFEFIEFKKFNFEVDFSNRVELYCKMLLEFESDYSFTSNYKVSNETKYLVVYPKEIL